MSRSTLLIEYLESRVLLSATLVRLDTTLGLIDVQLTDDVTPNTVANFLNYVNSGRYNNTFFQRNSGNVIQAGGFTASPITPIVTDAPVANEFQSGVTTNIRGTIGMAKASADSATDQFFFNLVDNSSSFDNPANAGGFTTFGTITSLTLPTMDAIAAVPVTHVFNAPFDNLPLINYSGSGSPIDANFVKVKTASVVGVFTNSVTLGNSSAVKSVVFTDGDGTLTSVVVRGAAGTITFGGTDVFETVSRGRATITGTGLTLNGIALTGATNAVLSIAGKGGDGVVDVGNITAAGSVAAISAPTTHFAGTLNVSSYLGSALFRSISNSSMFVNDATVPLKLRVVGAIADSQLTDVGAIGSIQAAAWTDSSGTVSQITATSIGKFVIPGEMAADLNLTGGILSAKLGTVSAGNWFLGGNIVKLAIGQTIAGWTATLGGSIVKMSVGTLVGNLTANTIVSLKAAAISGANINLVKNYDGLTPALAKLSAGSITNTHIRSTDNLGSISAGSFTDSFVSAGINFGNNSINDVTGFEHVATIAAFRSGTFNNSSIIAQNLGKVAIGLTSDAAPTLPFFGVAADKITSFSAVVIDKKLALRLLDDAALVPGLIAAQNVTLNNLRIQVV